jgi:hypothetical protein
MPITTGNTPKALSGGTGMGSWMQPHGSGSTIVKHPGSLRATAKRMGLVKGDANLSSHALSVMKKRGGPVTRKRVALAKVFKGAHHNHGGHAHHPPARG